MKKYQSSDITNLFNKILLILLVSLNLINISYTQWVKSTVIGGHADVYGLGIYNNIMFAGTGSGIYLSTDFGNLWTYSVNVYNMTSFASNEGNIFIGTDDFGVIHSTDNGANWQPIHNGLTNIRVRALLYTGSKLIAGTAKPKYKSVSGGLYVTTDNGANWVKSGLVGLDVYALMSKNSNLYAGTSNGVYISTDNGDTWDSLNTGINNVLINTLAVNDSNLFAGSRNDIYISTNKGASWFKIKTFLYPEPVYTLLASKNRIYAGTGEGIYFTNNNGKDWEKLDSTYMSVGVASLLLRDSVLYVGTRYSSFFYTPGKGVLASTDLGITWKLKTAGLTSVDEIRAFADFGDKLVSGSYGDGNLISTDNGNSWIESAQTPDRYVDGFATDGSKIMYGSPNGLYISYDTCTSWESLPIPWWGGTALGIVDNVLFANFRYGLSISTDSGMNWHESNLYYSDGVSAETFEHLGGYLFAGTSNGLYVSSDNGSTWNFSETGAHNPNGTEILALVKNSSSQLFLGSPCQGVLTSIDSGKSWKKLNNGLSDSCVYALAVRESDIFAGTWPYGNIFYSSDTGANWKQINSGFKNSGIYSLFIKGDRIFAGIDGGIYWRSISEITGINENNEKVPNQYLLNQNYPNPFNPITTISYQIPKSGLVSLKVYDILGREVTVLVNEEKTFGKYEVEFNGRKLSSGIYFCRLQTGDYSLVKKMVLIK